MTVGRSKIRAEQGRSGTPTAGLLWEAFRGEPEKRTGLQKSEPSRDDRNLILQGSSGRPFSVSQETHRIAGRSKIRAEQGRSGTPTAGLLWEAFRGEPEKRTGLQKSEPSRDDRNLILQGSSGRPFSVSQETHRNARRSKFRRELTSSGPPAAGQLQGVYLERERLIWLYGEPVINFQNTRNWFRSYEI